MAYITNLTKGDCCSEDMVTIPVAYLSLLESAHENCLEFYSKFYEFEMTDLLSEDQNKDIKYKLWNIECDSILIKEAEKHFKDSGIEYPKITHNLHKCEKMAKTG